MSDIFNTVFHQANYPNMSLEATQLNQALRCPEIEKYFEKLPGINYNIKGMSELDLTSTQSQNILLLKTGHLFVYD